MAVERKFVENAIKKMQVGEFLEKRLKRVGYSKASIQRTPVLTRIGIYVRNPARVIGFVDKYGEKEVRK